MAGISINIALLSKHEALYSALLYFILLYSTLLHTRQVGQACHNIALLYRNTKQTAKAEVHYERSRNIWVKEQQWPLLAVSFKVCNLNRAFIEP